MRSPWVADFYFLEKFVVDPPECGDRKMELPARAERLMRSPVFPLNLLHLP